MTEALRTRTIILFFYLITLVVGLSSIFSHMWSGEARELPEPQELIIQEGMTVGEFGRANDLSNPILKEIFRFQVRSDLQKKLSEYGTSDQIKSLAKKKLALATESATKNWIKILVKFGLWSTFLSILFAVFRKQKVTPSMRKWLLFIGVLLFGVIMGSDPSPMGTVKDAIYLYVSERVIFPPRMIALTVFLTIVFLVNKYICAWGCQLGALQDLIFRLNQTDGRKAILGKQLKPLFAFTNTVRIAFLGTFSVVAFVWGVDIVELIDPFKIFNPAYIGIAGTAFACILLITSLVIYRPWCHLFCPFGLVSWVIEKISKVRVSVNYETCIACEKCATACPSTVMGAILKREKKTIPDCFSCYTCRGICPTESISFSTRKRTLPPRGHFKKDRRSEAVAKE